MIKANKKNFLWKNQSDSMLDMINKQWNNDVVKWMLSVIEWVRIWKESLVEYLESLKYDKEWVFNDILDELNKQVEMINNKFVENDKTIKTLLTKQDKKEIQWYINNISRLTIKIEYNIEKLNEKKADKKHGHTIWEINWLRDELDSKTRLISEIWESFTVKEKDFKDNLDKLKSNLSLLTDSLKNKADINHKHTEYALKEDLDLLAQRPVHISWWARIDDNQTTPNATWSSEKIQAEINAWVWWGWTWWSITWTLSNQTDLQTALDAKVTWPATATDNAIARYDSTTWELLQDSLATVSDLWEISTPSNVVAAAFYTSAHNWVAIEGSNAGQGKAYVYATGNDTNIDLELSWQWTGKVKVTDDFHVTGTTKIDTLTASEIVITDASKNLISAWVATYPSLTELTYLKWVTSPIQTQLNAFVNAMIYKGNRDASIWTFPWAWLAQIWWFYTVSVWGTVDSVVFNIWDRLVAIANNASTTVYSWNWNQLDATDAVTSVNGQTWNVTWIQEIATVISWSTTAVNDGIYVVVATAIISDPTPVEWKWYTVIVRNWTATVWGTWYAVAWSEILRIYNSWAWENYLKTPTSDFVTLTWSETLTNKTLTAPKFADLWFIADANGNELIIMDTVASAVNEITIANAATTKNPSITATWWDTNIGVDFFTKWTWSFNFKSNTTWPVLIRLYEDSDNWTSSIWIRSAASLAADYTITLPNAVPAADNYALTSTTWWTASWTEVVLPTATQTLTNKTITWSLPIAWTSAWPASLSLAEDTDNGTNKITIQAPASLAWDYTLTLPADDWASWNYLKTDWSWALSWDTPAAWSWSYNPVLAQVFM